MPKLEEVEREYRKLQTRLTYEAFEEGEADPTDARRFRELSELRIRLSAPNMAAAA